MSIQEAKEQVEKFLCSDTPEVLAIKGEWGAGKTYFWKNCFEHLKKENKIKLQKYCYVSLFGINSLKDLKVSIFYNTGYLDPALCKDKDIKKKLLQGLRKIKEPIKKISGMFTNISIDISAIIPLDDEEVIICIDDLERKSQNIEIKEIMGFLSFLKEEKKCKVALIFNEEKILHDENYNTLKEKVIDVEIAFKPDTEELLDIAFSKDSSCLICKEIFLNIKIKNIRILKKIEALFLKIKDIIYPSYEPIVSQILGSLILYCWTYYTDIDKKRFNFLKEFNKKLPDEKEEENIKYFRQILNVCNYHRTEMVDLVIADAVEHGFFNENKLKEGLDNILKQYEKDFDGQSFNDAMTEIYGSLDNKKNDKELSQVVLEAFKKICNGLQPIHLERTIRALKDLDENELVEDAIDFYIEKNKSNPHLFKVDQFLTGIKDPDVIRKLGEAWVAFQKRPCLKEVLNEIAEKQYLSEEHKNYLNKVGKDEFSKLFKNTSTYDISKYIRKLKEQEIDTAINTLKEIGKERVLYKKIIEEWGIKEENFLTP